MTPVLWKSKEARWNPFREFEVLQDEMNKLFNFSLGRYNEKDGGTLEAAWTPAIDVLDGKNNIRILAEIPGLNKEDIQVSVDGDILTIHGEKKKEEEKKEEGYVRTERTYGAFYRAMTLPKGIDTASVKANYKNGVLELTLDKKEEAKPKQITVNVN